MMTSSRLLLGTISPNKSISKIEVRIPDVINMLNIEAAIDAFMILSNLMVYIYQKVAGSKVRGSTQGMLGSKVNNEI